MAPDFRVQSLNLYMLTRCVRRVLLKPGLPTMRSTQCSRGRCCPAPHEGLDRVRTLLQLCTDRYFISPGELNLELFQCGFSCSYGPLGVELRRNLLEQWWHSVTGSTAQVWGIKTLSSSREERAACGPLLVETERFQQMLKQGKDQLAQELQRTQRVRTNLLQGNQCVFPLHYK